MTSREFIQLMLIHASEETLDQLMKAPGLQFLYPLAGLVWVNYRGRGLANYEGTLHNFDPTKIQGIRYNDCEVEAEVEVEVDDHVKNKDSDLHKLSVECEHEAGYPTPASELKGTPLEKGLI